jgi:hypothetical protein
LGTLLVVWAVLGLLVPTAVGSVVVGCLVLRWRSWRPWLLGMVALAWLAGYLWVQRAEALAFHFAGLPEFLRTWLGEDKTGATRALLNHLAHTAPIGVPVGLFVAGGFMTAQEWGGRGAPWHPATQRRRARDEQAEARQVVRRVLRADDSRCDGPALAVHRGGTLPEWVQGPYVVLPDRLRGHALLVAGMPDSGKTETLKRLAYDAGRRGMKLVFADCKGTDPTLAAEVLAAYRIGRGDDGIRLRCWPAEPLDMWRGEPAHVANRLMAVKDYVHPWFTDVAAVAVRLALEAQGEPACTDSREFLERLDYDWLAKRWAEDRSAMVDLDAARANHGLEGVHLRYSAFFSSVGAAFDGGASFEDVEVLVLTLPTLVARRDAEAAVRLLLEDFAHYAAARKPRRGEDVRLIVDEFSAVDGLVDQATHLAERLRDVRGGVVLAAQSWEGLGDDWKARRLVGADAALILHRVPFPEPFLQAAGQIEVPDQTWRLDEYGSTGEASVTMRSRPLVDPMAVRHSGTGEAWLITPGRVLRIQVLQVHADGMVADARRALATAGQAAERPPWVVDLPLAPGAADGPWRALPGGRLGGPAPPDGAPVPAVPDRPGTRLLLQLATAVREHDPARVGDLVAVGVEQAPGWDGPAEIAALQRALRLARMPALLRLLVAAVGRLPIHARRSQP